MSLIRLHLSPKNKNLALSLALLLILSGCGGPPGGGWQMPPPVVDVSTAAAQSWTIEYSATGTLEANNKVDLNAEAPGTITQIRVKEGDIVKRGQVLMRLKADKQLAQVQESAAGIKASQGSIEQHKADVNQARARVESAKVRLNLAQSELQRYEKLYRDQFISQLELDQKRSNYEVAASAYQEAMQGLSSAQAEYHQASSSLAQARSSHRYNVAVANESFIRAPFSGVVGQKYVDLGDYVAPTEKLVTLVDPSLFKIQFTVPERYLHQLKEGLPVTVSFEGLANAKYSGHVNFIDPVINVNAHTVAVKAVVPNSGGLRHGLYGTVALSLGSIDNAVVIPEEAIVPQGEKTFVYVVKYEVYRPTVQAGPEQAKKNQAEKKDKSADQPPTTVAHLQEVMIGHRKAGRVHIQSGLNAGERVIVSGLQKVSDNMPVNLNDGKTGMNGPKGH